VDNGPCDGEQDAAAPVAEGGTLAGAEKGTRPRAPEKRRGETVSMGLTGQEALDLFASDDLMGIGMAANALRKKKNDPRVATYQIDRNINYTNFCTEYCSFCAFTGPWAPRTATCCRWKRS